MASDARIFPSRSSHHTRLGHAGGHCSQSPTGGRRGVSSDDSSSVMCPTMYERMGGVRFRLGGHLRCGSRRRNHFSTKTGFSAEGAGGLAVVVRVNRGMTRASLEEPVDVSLVGAVSSAGMRTQADEFEHSAVKQ